MTILDQFGKPFALPRTRQSETATSAADAVFIRPAWMQPVSPGLEPARLAQILRDLHAGGDNQNFLTLCKDMEERDLHFYSLLQTRRLAVSGAPHTLQPADESDGAQKIADEVEKYLIDTPEWSEMSASLLDAFLKGFAVNQLIWDPTTRPYWTVRYVWEDQRKFRFDWVTQTELRLRNATQNGLELEPGRFVVHYSRLRPGPPLEGALGRLAAVTWMFKNFTVRDWVAFAEVYGMPLRVASYDPASFTDDELTRLKYALANMGHDAAGLIPNKATLEIHDVNRGSGAGPFSTMAEYWDKQLSKGVLGQTMTSDDGSSLAQASVHEKVRQDIRADDARKHAWTLQSVIRMWVQINFGVDAPVPRYCPETEPGEDLALFTTAVLPWVKDAGLKVSISQLRDKLDLEEPDGPEDELGAPDPLAMIQTTAEAKAANAPPPVAGKQPTKAPNAQLTVPTSLPQSIQLVEDLAAALADDWETLLEPYRQVLQRAANRASTYDELLMLLDFATEQMDSNEFVRRVTIAGMEARGIGAGRPV